MVVHIRMYFLVQVIAQSKPFVPARFICPFILLDKRVSNAISLLLPEDVINTYKEYCYIAITQLQRYHVNYSLISYAPQRPEHYKFTWNNRTKLVTTFFWLLTLLSCPFAWIQLSGVIVGFINIAAYLRDVVKEVKLRTRTARDM